MGRLNRGIEMIDIGTILDLRNFHKKGRQTNLNSRLFTFSLLHKSEKCISLITKLSEVLKNVK